MMMLSSSLPLCRPISQRLPKLSNGLIENVRFVLRWVRESTQNPFGCQQENTVGVSQASSLEVGQKRASYGSGHSDEKGTHLKSYEFNIRMI